MSFPVVEVRDLRKIYTLGDQSVAALDGVTLTIERQEFVVVMGPSGSGKSTFMHIVGFLDRPTSGRYLFEAADVSELDADARADIRSRRLGFVFQSYNLLPRTSAVENVELPMLYAGAKPAVRRQAALEALDAVALAAYADHVPSQLSGGQQQRVAIARALVNQPTMILADEPTGALDSRAGHEIMSLFNRLNAERGITVLVVTHDRDVASHGKRLVTFRDGRVTNDQPIDGALPLEAAAAG
jgi:putative ABC transport system ATP-binding protein